MEIVRESSEREWFDDLTRQVDELKTRLPYSDFNSKRVDNVIEMIHKGDESARDRLFLSTGLNPSVAEFIVDRQRTFQEVTDTFKNLSSFELTGSILEQRVIYVNGNPTGTYLVTIDLKLRETPYILHLFLYSPETVAENLLDNKMPEDVSCPATLYGCDLYIERVRCHYRPGNVTIHLSNIKLLESFLEDYEIANKTIIEVEIEGILSSSIPYQKLRNKLPETSNLILEEYKIGRSSNSLTKQLYERIQRLPRYSQLETSLSSFRDSLIEGSLKLSMYNQAYELLNEALVATEYCHLETSHKKISRQLERCVNDQKKYHSEYQKTLQKLGHEILVLSDDDFIKTNLPIIESPRYHLTRKVKTCIDKFRNRYLKPKLDAAITALENIENELEKVSARALDSISIDLAETREFCRHRTIHPTKQVDSFLNESLFLLQRQVDSKTLYLLSCQLLDYSEQYREQHFERLHELRVRLLLQLSDLIVEILPTAETYPEIIRMFQYLTQARPPSEIISSHDYIQKVSNLNKTLTSDGLTFQLTELLCYRPDNLTEDVRIELSKLAETTRLLYTVHMTERKNLYLKQLSDLVERTCRQLQKYVFTCTIKVTYSEFHQLLCDALENPTKDTFKKVYSCDITELCNDLDTLTLLKLSQLLSRLELKKLQFQKGKLENKIQKLSILI